MEIKETILRIVLSVALCGLIGWERGRRHKGAGLRTHILVGVGSTLIVLTSLFIFEQYKNIAPIDPTRMITGIITGIGFLCAGTIIRGSSNVKGLTTAATLWISSCLGIAIGAGHYSSAIIVTIVVYFVLIGIDSLKNKADIRKSKKTNL